MNRHNQEPQRYRFRIRGRLGAATLRAFPEMVVESDGADTLLTGILPDRAALYGAISQIERFGLDLLGIRRLPDDQATDDGLNAEDGEPA